MGKWGKWFNMNNPYGYRDDNLQRLGFETYHLYLKSSLWKGIRAQVLQATPQCFKCHKRKATQVHHRAYDSATLRGDDLRSLTAICGPCHLRAERPGDFSSSRYDKFKAAGDVMFRRGHPTQKAKSKRRRKAGAKYKGYQKPEPPVKRIKPVVSLAPRLVKVGQ